MEERGRKDERMEDGGEKEGRRNGWRREGKIVEKYGNTGKGTKGCKVEEREEGKEKEGERRKGCKEEGEEKNEVV